MLYSVIFFSNDYFSFLLFSVGDFLKVCTESSALSAAVVSVYIFCHLSFLYTFFIQGSILALYLTVFFHSAFMVSQHFFSGASGQKDHGLFCIPSLPLCATGTVHSFLLKATDNGNLLMQLPPSAKYVFPTRILSPFAHSPISSRQFIFFFF